MKSRVKANGSGFTEGRVVAAEVRRTVGRGIGANVEVEDSSRGTRGQLVGRTVEVQVDEIPLSPWADAKENQVRSGSAPLGKKNFPAVPDFQARPQAASVSKYEIMNRRMDDASSHQRGRPFPARTQSTPTRKVGSTQFAHFPNSMGSRPIRVHGRKKRMAWALTAARPVVASIRRHSGRGSFESPTLRCHQA